MAEHRDASLHFDEPAFTGRKPDAALHKKSSQRLHMPAAQPTMRPKRRRHECRCRVRDAILKIDF
jgi:hypothetical protein